MRTSASLATQRPRPHTRGTIRRHEPDMFDALLDASVLIPGVLGDPLLRAAEAGLYHPRWTDDILSEVRRNLVQDGLTTEEGADRRVVAGYQELLDRMVNNPKDRYVLAAAVMASSRFIVTTNL